MTTATPTRVLVLGIDAASPVLLERWIADGTLPNLAALVQRGLSSRVRSVDGFFIGSTWPSVYTGTTPANHGVHYLLELQRGTYELRHSVDGAFVRRPAFWRALSDAGKRVAILDVPLSRLEQNLNGVQIVEWGGHDSIYGFSASPESLATHIHEQFGPHPVGSTCDAENRTTGDYADFVRRLELGAERKGVLSRELLSQGNWDLFMQVFTEGHCAGHQCWHMHDSAHPAHDAAAATAVGNPLRQAYAAIDREIGSLVAMAPNAHVVVFSGHGMGHWYGAQFLLHDILVKLGASVARPVAPPTLKSQAIGVARQVWRRLPQRIRSLIKQARSSVASTPKTVAHTPSISADVTRSRCLVHPNGLAVGGIRLNLIGREPGGLLTSGAEADTFVSWLRESLLAIVDTRTGKPIIRSVRRTSDLYTGENLDLLPDLLVEWSDEVATGSTNVAGGIGATVTVSSPLIGSISGVNDFGRTGEHRNQGWMVAAGPGITHGQFSSHPNVIDLAPTFAAMLGVTLANVDGKPIEQLATASNGRNA